MVPVLPAHPVHSPTRLSRRWLRAYTRSTAQTTCGEDHLYAASDIAHGCSRGSSVCRSRDANICLVANQLGPLPVLLVLFPVWLRSPRQTSSDGTIEDIPRDREPSNRRRPMFRDTASLYSPRV